MSKSVLVAGGAGFIGVHLCKALLGQGHRVLCVDNISTGLMSNVALFDHHPDFEFLRHDIQAPLHIEVDEIYNLACPASPSQYSLDPIETIKTSVLGTLNLAELARKTDARLLHTSTSEVYGDPEVHPQIESYFGNVDPTGRRACYNEGKRCAETILFDYHRQHGTQIKVARLFNVYGPYVAPSDGRVASNFISQALAGQALTIYGDGSQTRSFCYVSDMITALMRLMATERDVVGPLNLGNPSEITVLELVRLVLEKTGSSAEIEHRPLPDDDPARRRPDITLAKQMLSWEPEVSLADGIARTIEWYRSVL